MVVEDDDTDDDANPRIKLAQGDELDIVNGGTLGTCRVIDCQPPVCLPADMGGQKASRLGVYALVKLTSVTPAGRKAGKGKGPPLFNRGDVIKFDDAEIAAAETAVPPATDEGARTLPYYFDASDHSWKNVLIWTSYLRHKGDKGAAEPDTTAKKAVKSKKAGSGKKKR